MKRFHVKKGDEVVVIAGSARGRRGVIRTVVAAKQTVILESADAGKKQKEGEEEAAAEPVEKRKLIKPVLHYMRKTQQSPQGGLMWLEGEIHISKVMLAEKFDARAAKRGAAPAAES